MTAQPKVELPLWANMTVQCPVCRGVTSVTTRASAAREFDRLRWKVTP